MTKGTKVWYTDWHGTRHAAVVVGTGEERGETVYDLTIVGKTNPLERNRWGYADQVEAR